MLLARAGAPSGERLYAEYFDAEPVSGYGTQRAFVRLTDQEASVLRQAITYHQDRDYDYAIMAFRNYLATNPIPADPRIAVLAGTAAMATGHHQEAREYFDLLTEEDGFAYAESLWYGALNELHADRLPSVRVLLEELRDNRYASEYPLVDLMPRLPVVR